MWRQCVLTIGSIAALSLTSVAQAPVPQPTLANLGGFSEDYRVGANDLLEIHVVGHTDLNQTLRISNSGDISFPMAGIIPVAGLTAFEVEEAIAARLRDQELIQDPEVLVYVTDYQAKRISVSGAVVREGEFVMSQELTVMDAILLAGGLDFNADVRGFIHRRIQGEDGGRPSNATTVENPDIARPGTEVIEVDLEPLLEGRLLESNPPLQRGDALIVPERRMNAFFVVGEVEVPRNYFYPPDKTVMASQAISWSAGPTQTAKMSDGILVRFDEQGERTEMKVDYAAILEGRQEDFPIQADDIIFIPGSRVKTITQGLLQQTDSMVMMASFRVARSYQLPEAPEREPRPGESR